MSRKLKNTITILLIICLGALSYFTVQYAANPSSSASPSAMHGSGAPPDMPSGNSQQGGNFEGQIPEKSDGDNSSNSQPPEKPDGDSSLGNQEGQSRNQPPGGMNGAPNEMPSTKNGISTIYYILFGIESLGISLLLAYLFLSKFNKKGWKETLKTGEKVTIYILTVVILTSGLTALDSYSANHYSGGMQISGGFENGNSQTPMNPAGSIEVDGEEKTLSDSYSSQDSDQSIILVKNGGNLILKGATAEKLGGDSSNTENSEFYGINAGILVTENSSATISDSNISTNAKGSNAVFSTGSDSKIYLTDCAITTTGSSSSRGLDATYGGYIEAQRVKITTQGGSCAALATDRGEGTVIANDSNLETNGSGSPVIYSTGDISVSNTQGRANGSQMAVIEGKNSATVENSTLIASGKGNRGDVDNAGIMIYQSMSGDASVGTGTFTVSGSTLKVSSDSSVFDSAPMFFVTNTDATINLNNTELIYGSNILICAKGTSEWGTGGSNGGNITLNATNQNLSGDILLDSISTITMNLDDSSTYKGAINSDNSAKECKLALKKGSKVTLTGDCYLTSLEDEDSTYSNIDFNGYKLFVNGTAISE